MFRTVERTPLRSAPPRSAQAPSETVARHLPHAAGDGGGDSRHGRSRRPCDRRHRRVRRRAVAASRGFGSRCRKRSTARSSTARGAPGAARPTAVNLFWALDADGGARRPAMRRRLGNVDARGRVSSEAQAIHDEDLASCRAIGRHGAALVPERASVLTHCNAGGLATAGLRHGARRRSAARSTRERACACSRTRRARSCRARG